MNIEDIKKEASLGVHEIQIDWEKMEDPIYRRDFESIIERAIQLIPDLEGLYVKLTSGKSVLFPEEETSLPYDDVEKYKDLVAEELFNGYLLQELLNKYRVVNDVMNAAYPLDNPPEA
jgi:hypothetical protein